MMSRNWRHREYRRPHLRRLQIQTYTPLFLINREAILETLAALAYPPKGAFDGHFRLKQHREIQG
jgi:hypothetical protein